jgi:hypothetical protein
VNEEFLRRSYERLLVIREHDGPDRDLCPTVDEIHALVKREGDESARLRLLDHVMQCPECRKEFDLLRSVELSRPKAVASNWKLWAFAATLVLVAGATVVWQMIMVEPARDDILRGASGQLQLVSPQERAAVRLPATLTWHSVPGAPSYRVELLDGSGSTIWSFEAADTTLLLVNPPVGEVVSWKVVAEFPGGLPLESPTRQLRIDPATP